MECERRSSKGGFLQLFEWNVKSRKKLFSSKSELFENSKLGKEISNDSTISQLHPVRENRYTPSPRENYDLNYLSSVNDDDDDEKGTRAPGVVARLMGLDSLPTSSDVPESRFTPSFESHSFRDSYYSRGISGPRNEEQIVIYDSMRNKLDGFTKNPVDLMLQKVQSRRIERFQTEVLPPKSAKPISVTHHKLLSPIKSPGFIPTMNASYLMETAAKIIEQNPRLAATHKLPSLGSSSISLRIQDIKEKLESSQKSSRALYSPQRVREPNNAKCTKRQSSSDRFQSQGEAPDLLRNSGTSRKPSYEGLKGKAKSVSPPTQLKATVHKRNPLASPGNWNSANQKEGSDVKNGFVGRNQQKPQKSAEKRSSVNKQSDVLKQNNQKQNCVLSKERDGLRPSVSQQKEKLSSATEVSKPTKTVNRVVISTAATSRKTNSFANDAGKDQPSSTRRRSSKKPQHVGNSVSDGNSNIPASKDGRSIKCNFEEGSCTKWNAAGQKNGMDVVSFTFTSPIKKSCPESGSSGRLLESKRSLNLLPNSCDNNYSFGLDVSGGDALNLLLEEKLKELTTRVDSSHQGPISNGYLCNSVNSLRESITTDLNIQQKFDPLFNTELRNKGTWKWQGSEKVEDPSGNSKCGRELEFQNCSPVTSLEPSYSECSYNSMDSSRSLNSKGRKKCIPVEATEIKDWCSIRNSLQEPDDEIADSASSTSFGTSSVTYISSAFDSVVVESSPWELEYIRCLLVNMDLRLEEWALSQAPEIIPQDLFGQLEDDEKPCLNPNMEENLKLERKLIFDYVEESLHLKCVQHFGGSWKHWLKSAMVSRRKDLLAEELYREVSGWRSMEELMVDELVDKDMSSQLGKWIDFEIEAFEEGKEIEKVILTHLVDELIDEILWF